MNNITLTRTYKKNLILVNRTIYNNTSMSLSELETLLLHIKSTYSEYTNIRVTIVKTKGWDSSKIQVYGDRLETDEELAARQESVGRNKKYKQDQEEQKIRDRELAELARLKAKYESD